MDKLDPSVWSCPVCTFENESASANCQQCAYEHGAGTQAVWQCSRCTLLNPIDVMICTTCDNLGPKEEQNVSTKSNQMSYGQAVNLDKLTEALPDWKLFDIPAESDGGLKPSSNINFPDSECRLVLLGKTGHGKSSTGNTILGIKRFEESCDFQSVTQKCQRFSSSRFGVSLEVVDTPGIFDTSLDHKTIMTEIAKCISIVSPGPHAIVLVLRFGVRFTKEEAAAIDRIYELIGSQLLRHLVIVFSHGDQLQVGADGYDATVRKVLDGGPPAFTKLIKSVQGRYVIFNNNGSMQDKDKQVRQLLLTIERLLKLNGGKPFTNNLLTEVEKILQEREEEVAKDLGMPLGRDGHRLRSDSALRQHIRDIIREEIAQEKGSSFIKTKILPALEILRVVLVPLLRFSMSAGKCLIL